MKSEIINRRKQLKTGFPTETYEGETIEKKCARMIENNEPITDGAPSVFTKRADGVRPEFNIRTDKWDIAQESMGKVSEAKKDKIKEKMAKGMPEKTKEPEEK
jgi:hypothetical protein